MDLHPAADDANRKRQHGAVGHYEVWYVTLSHVATQTGFWLRYTLEIPQAGHGDPYAQLWFARFDSKNPERTFGINHKVPFSTLTASDGPFGLRIGDNTASSSAMRGSLDGGGHRISWDFRWEPSARVHRHLPTWAYRGTWADTQVLSPSVNSAADGEIIVDGERYQLTGTPLGQTHLWGKKHAYSWAWSHCNAFEGEKAGTAIETLSVRLRRGSVVLPTLTMLALYVDGEEPIRFAEPWQLPFTRSTYGTGRYQLRAADAFRKVEATFTCRPEDMLMAEYIDPDGDPAYCHNTECADLSVVVWKRSAVVSRWRLDRTLTARRTAHYEWGARAGDPLVRKRHQAV